LADAQVAELRIVDPELARFEFLTPDDAARRLRPDMADRLRRATEAQQAGNTDYSERHR